MNETTQRSGLAEAPHQDPGGDPGAASTSSPSPPTGWRRWLNRLGTTEKVLSIIVSLTLIGGSVVGAIRWLDNRSDSSEPGTHSNPDDPEREPTPSPGPEDSTTTTDQTSTTTTTSSTTTTTRPPTTSPPNTKPVLVYADQRLVMPAPYCDQAFYDLDTVEATGDTNNAEVQMLEVDCGLNPMPYLLLGTVSGLIAEGAGSPPSPEECIEAVETSPITTLDQSSGGAVVCITTTHGLLVGAVVTFRSDGGAILDLTAWR